MMSPYRLFTVFALALPLCLAQAVLPPPAAPADAVAQPPAAVAESAPAPRTAPAGKPAEAAPETATRPYVFGALDLVDIKVWNSGNLSGIFPIGPDGMLSLPLIGQIKAEGLTQPDLNRIITEKLNSLMNNPEVNVQLARNNSKKYYIMGEVYRPGEYPLLSDMTVLDAFANCGGFKDFANPKRIYILRENGRQKLSFNYNEVIKGKKMEQNIHLQSGDRLVVP